MSSASSSPEQYEKTVARQQSTGDNFANFYINDEDGNLPRNRGAATDPPSAPVSPKTKKPAVRKHNPTTPKKTGKTTDATSQESSPTPKSPRIARGENKRSAKAMEADDIAENVKSAPVKKRKITTTTKTVDPAAIQKHTGRFTPINAQIKRAKKIEKRPADSAEADAPPKKRAKKSTGTLQVTAIDVLNDLVEMGIRAADEESDNDATEETAAEETTTDTEDAPVKPKPKGKGKGKGKAKAKAKAQPEKAAAPQYTSNQMGSTVEKPDDATNDTAWKCANRSCNTGMTWYKRDGAGGLGRKVISHFFGRNKKETHRIHSEIWHIYCRKCYQRHSYRHKNAQSSCRYFVENIEMQLARLKIWRPQAKFVVQLTKGAQVRLSNYRKELRNNGGDEAKAAEKVYVEPEIKNGKPVPQTLEDSFLIKKMEEFDNTFATTQAEYDYDRLLTIVSWISDEVKAKRIETMPPMEFLMNAIGDDEETTDPDMNYEAWTVLEDKQGSSDTDSEEEQAETESAVAGPSGTHNQANDSDETESAVAGPSGTQHQDSDSNETESESSEAEIVTTKKHLTGAAALPLYDSSSPQPHTPLEETFLYKASLALDAFEAKQASEEDDDDDDSESEPEPEEPVTPTPVSKRIRISKE